MAVKKRAVKRRRRALARAAAPLAAAQAFPWKRAAWIFSGLIFAFVLGVIVGTRQGWVEGVHGHGSSANEQFQVRELESGATVKHGLYQFFYPGGRILKESGDYFMGKKHGAWSSYFPSGKLQQRVSYIDGEPQGDLREWDENGAEITKNSRP